MAELETLKATASQVSIIEGLVPLCPLTEWQRNEIDQMLEDITLDEASELIGWLKSIRVDPITHGGNYGQRDIIEHLRKLQ